jgi:hypothetical protein
MGGLLKQTFASLFLLFCAISPVLLALSWPLLPGRQWAESPLAAPAQLPLKFYYLIVGPAAPVLANAAASAACVAAKLRPSILIEKSTVAKERF